MTGSNQITRMLYELVHSQKNYNKGEDYALSGPESNIDTKTSREKINIYTSYTRLDHF